MNTNPLAQYDYSFPKSAIAQSPASPRDSAKLLVYNRATKKVVHDTFRNLPDYLPKNAVLVFNETKVIPARLILTKPTGGKIRVLYLSTEKDSIKVLADRPLRVGTNLTLTPRLTFSVTAHTEKYYFLKPNFAIKNVQKVLEQYGAAPIPPYIKETPLTPATLKSQYQTVFARERGSVAAPTASLHFTKGLLQKLRSKGITIAFVTLHVGLGTFSPVTEEQIEKRELHHEHYEISKKTAKILETAKKQKRPIIAVGTTVVRTLESAAALQENGVTIKKRVGDTNLFIQEGYRFKMTDGIITNFHVPQSSLLMLVSAFAGRENVLNLYKSALQKKYRFFSFGDGMLIV